MRFFKKKGLKSLLKKEIHIFCNDGAQYIGYLSEVRKDFLTLNFVSIFEGKSENVKMAAQKFVSINAIRSFGEKQ